jgi:hypothetical protein
VSKLTLKGAKKKAWTAFSLYIRTKYSKDGMCTCFTCDREYPIKEIQAGHGVPGRSNSVLFLEEIVRPQCPGCNVFQAGRYDVFIPKLIEMYGLDGYKEFQRMKNDTKKLTINDFLDIEREYKEALDDL